MKTARARPKRDPGDCRIAIQRVSALRGLPTNTAMRGWVAYVLRRFRRTADLTVRVVDAREGAALNRRWRGRRGPTNVLAFPFAEGEDGVSSLLGDIVLCAPVLKAEAAAQRKTIAAHCAHLLVHATLHLLGYDHQRARDAAKMERLEVELLAELEFPDPYVERP